VLAESKATVANHSGAAGTEQSYSRQDARPILLHGFLNVRGITKPSRGHRLPA
jgi:hypothetical protein